MSELSEREIERLTTELRAAAAIAKRLSEAEDEIEKLRTAGAQAMICTHDLAERETACADGMCPLCSAAELERLRAAPLSRDELNLIKSFWRAEPSCMAQNCNADCNPLTAHCGRGP